MRALMQPMDSNVTQAISKMDYIRWQDRFNIIDIVDPLVRDNLQNTIHDSLKK